MSRRTASVPIAGCLRWPAPDQQTHAAQRLAQIRDPDSEWSKRCSSFVTLTTLIEPRNVNRSWDTRIAKAGVPKITVHDARRTCGTLLVDLDVHPRVIMTILRHANFNVTMEIYSQSWPPAGKEGEALWSPARHRLTARCVRSGPAARSRH